jgi:TonB-dependent starch-binding outer membrane protein SusC
MNRNLHHMKKFVQVFVGCVIMFCSARAFAQNDVTGIVKEQGSGVGMPGVSVAVKGTSIGVITDADGNFSLNVAEGSVLVFSFIGYETVERTVTGATRIEISLKESTTMLDEVVMIGYGTTTKKEITGAVTSIKEKDFNTGRFNDPMGLIQGKVAGLSIAKPNGADPLAGYQILLRGTNTLTSGTSPLIIIDGVIGADLKNINFQDVESFDVLKDGSAAAIYGTRGTNGVIIITTKAAKTGKGTFEYSAQLSTQVAPRGVKNLNAEEFKQSVETYRPDLASGSLFGSDTDWFEEITTDAPISYQQNVALSGGTDKFSHRTSLTHSIDQGLLQENVSKRLLFKTNIQQKVLEDRLTLNFNLINSIRNYKPANYDIFRQAFIQNPTQPVYEDTDPTTGGYSYRQGLEYYNPVAMIKERTRDGKTNDIILNLRATVKILDNLNWDNFISTQRSEWEENSYKTRYYPTTLGRGEAEIGNGRSSNNQFESMFNYDTSFGNHNLQVVAGYSFQEFEQSNSYIGNSAFDTDVFQYNNIGVGQALVAGSADMSSGKSSSTVIALFGRAVYNYDEKYLASVSIRREGSSKFGDNNKWGWFPAVSVGWRLNEEGFMESNEWIDELKLRAGYGVTGNQDFAPYQSLILLERVGSLYYNQEWINSYGPGQNPNPNLRWEKKKEFNVGVDFAVLQQRLRGSIEFYERKSEDLLWLFKVPVPPYLYRELFTNVGTISNRGIEITLNGQLIKKGEFQWNSTLTASHNTNKLDKISSEEFPTTSYKSATTSGILVTFTQRIQEGEAIGTFYGPVFLGVENGVDVFKNQNPAGQVNESQWEDIGNANPFAIVGWSNDFTYKNWSLNVNFRAGLGGKVLNMYRLYYESWSRMGLTNIVHSQYENPEFTGDIVYSSKYVEDATFLKLDNVTLNYNFNLDSKYISRLTLFGSAQNVFWITGYKGIDPEVSRSGLEPGLDRPSYYPRTTSITLGVNATF